MKMESNECAAQNNTNRFKSPSPINQRESSSENNRFFVGGGYTSPKTQNQQFHGKKTFFVSLQDITIDISIDPDSKCVDLVKQVMRRAFQINSPSAHLICGVQTKSGQQIIDYWLASDHRNIEPLCDRDCFRAIYSDPELAAQPSDTISLAYFTFLQCLGKGGTSEVFLVRHKVSGKLFALKMVQKSHISDYKRLEQLLRERKILIDAANNNLIATMHSCFESANHLNFLLEFYPGGELFYHLQKKKLNDKEAKFFFSEILLCIEFLHSNQILYRDLKPENIVLDIQGHIRLTDFGLSQTGLQECDITDSFCGSPQYMAPQILQRGGYSYPVDIYTMGAFLYELTTGLPPYYANSTQRILSNISTMDLQIPDYVQPDLRSLLLQLLDKDPDERISDFNQIKNCKWLQDVDWDCILKKKYRPPIKIDIYHSYIHEEFKNIRCDINVNSKNPDSQGSHIGEELFSFFNYIRPSRELLEQSNNTNQTVQPPLTNRNNNKSNTLVLTNNYNNSKGKHNSISNSSNLINDSLIANNTYSGKPGLNLSGVGSDKVNFKNSLMEQDDIEAQIKTVSDQLKITRPQTPNEPQRGAPNQPINSKEKNHLEGKIQNNRPSSKQENLQVTPVNNTRAQANPLQNNSNSDSEHYSLSPQIQSKNQFNLENSKIQTNGGVSQSTNLVFLHSPQNQTSNLNPHNQSNILNNRSVQLEGGTGGQILSINKSQVHSQPSEKQITLPGNSNGRNGTSQKQVSERLSVLNNHKTESNLPVAEEHVDNNVYNQKYYINRIENEENIEEKTRSFLQNQSINNLQNPLGSAQALKNQRTNNEQQHSGMINEFSDYSENISPYPSNSRPQSKLSEKTHSNRIMEKIISNSASGNYQPSLIQDRTSPALQTNSKTLSAKLMEINNNYAQGSIDSVKRHIDLQGDESGLDNRVLATEPGYSSNHHGKLNSVSKSLSHFSIHQLQQNQNLIHQSRDYSIGGSIADQIIYSPGNQKNKSQYMPPNSTQGLNQPVLPQQSFSEHDPQPVQKNSYNYYESHRNSQTSQSFSNFAIPQTKFQINTSHLGNQRGESTGRNNNTQTSIQTNNNFSRLDTSNINNKVATQNFNNPNSSNSNYNHNSNGVSNNFQSPQNQQKYTGSIENTYFNKPSLSLQKNSVLPTSNNSLTSQNESHYLSPKLYQQGGLVQSPQNAGERNNSVSNTNSPNTDDLMKGVKVKSSIDLTRDSLKSNNYRSFDRELVQEGINQRLNTHSHTNASSTHFQAGFLSADFSDYNLGENESFVTATGSHNQNLHHQQISHFGNPFSNSIDVANLNQLMSQKLNQPINCREDYQISDYYGQFNYTQHTNPISHMSSPGNKIDARNYSPSSAMTNPIQFGNTNNNQTGTLTNQQTSYNPLDKHRSTLAVANFEQKKITPGARYTSSSRESLIINGNPSHQGLSIQNIKSYQGNLPSNGATEIGVQAPPSDTFSGHQHTSSIGGVQDNSDYMTGTMSSIMKTNPISARNSNKEKNSAYMSMINKKNAAETMRNNTSNVSSSNSNRNTDNVLANKNNSQIINTGSSNTNTGTGLSVQANSQAALIRKQNNNNVSQSQTNQNTFSLLNKPSFNRKVVNNNVGQNSGGSGSLQNNNSQNDSSYKSSQSNSKLILEVASPQQYNPPMSATTTHNNSNIGGANYHGTKSNFQQFR